MVSSLETFNNFAGRYWHDFYKNNGNRFFKDRHYLDAVFDELNNFQENDVDQYLSNITTRNTKLPYWRLGVVLETHSCLSATSIPTCEYMRVTLQSRPWILFWYISKMQLEWGYP